MQTERTYALKIVRTLQCSNVSILQDAEDASIRDGTVCVAIARQTAVIVTVTVAVVV